MMFRKFRQAALLAAAVILPLVGGAMAEPTADFAPLVRNVVDGYAVPKSQALAESFAALQASITGLCSERPSIAQKEAFDARFSASVEAYAQLAILRFGALADEHRLERLAFVPDARGVVRRQVDRLLARPDASATDPDRLRDKSVALQGLSALEWIAFSPDGAVILAPEGKKGAFTCAYAEAIAARLTATARELAEAYRTGNGQTGLLLAPSPENALVHTPQEAVESVFNALFTGLAVLRDQVLERVLEPGDPALRAERAPFARSGNEFTYLAAGLTGLNEAVTAGGFVAAAPQEGQWLANSLAFETKLATSALHGFDMPLAQVLADEESRRRLEVVEINTSSIRDLLGRELAGYLELKGGFNALDGD
ncbi:imelysin family protein [Stappia sp. F7233]|uniref:Imelysin family protein n=1 Tax=Stappia albiluteola TaxID=2758565 RepID=A0A839A8J6_9HYPH|nr:imelysin family protein [Stappia albiluteola]MBA5775880.1 imelysin family protein [Stappia albiluteola]